MAKQKSKKTNPKNKSKKKGNITSFDRQKWMIALGVFLFAFALYINTLGHGYVLDDDLVCNKNRFVQQGFAGLGDIFTNSWYTGFTGAADRYYRPMMLAGFAVEKSFLGNSSWTYHFMNVFYYALGCGFLFLILKKIFQEKHFAFPLAITLLFAAHPLHTEVVANIKSRDEIFAFLGMLGVVYGILKYHKTQNIIFFGIALASYFFAILSKEAALAILGIVPLVLYFFTNSSTQKIGAQTIVFGVLAAIYFLIRYQFIDHNPNPFETIDNSLFAIESPANQLSTAIAMLGKYFGLLVFPHPLSFDYSFNQIPEVGWSNWKVWLSLLISGGLIYLTVSGLREKKILSFSILFFAITFGITSNIFFKIGATFAERFMFLPLLGFCIAIVFLLSKYLDLQKPQSLNTFYGIIGILLLCYSAKTFTRNQAWKSDETLFATGILTAPNSSRTQSFYGVSQYRKSVLPQYAQEKNQLLDTAEEYLKKSIDIYPGFTETYQHLGQVYEYKNNIPTAIQTYEKALNSNPEYFPAAIKIGDLNRASNNYSNAITFYQKALEFAPNHVGLNRQMGLTYQNMKQYDLAISFLEKTLNLQYDDIHISDLGKLYQEMGDKENADLYYSKLLAYRKNNPQ